MSDSTMVNQVRSYSSGTPGRCLNQVRGHHFVIDEPPYAGGPGEEITPADAFLAGVSACGILLVESFAQKEGIPFQRGEASISGFRETSDPSRFQRVQMQFTLVGPSRAQAEMLVERYKGR